jgi:Tfp pilus assembly protein PilF
MNAKQNGRSFVRYVIGAAVVCLLAGVVVYALKSPPAPQPRQDEPSVVQQDLPREEPEDRWKPDEFVGSQKCAECHSELAKTFAAHPMANTLALVADAPPIEVIEGGAAEFEAQGRRYRVAREGDRMIHTEFMMDDAGQPIYEQSEEVRYVTGSGTNARTYLIDRGGIMFESPITWYTEKQKWDLSPGYHEDPSQRFNRRITDGCLQCHSGHPAPIGDGTSARFKEPPFVELGIGCERCHGPGKRHVEKQEGAASNADAGDAEDMLIVNPVRLEGLLKESVCYQCHMAGKRRILRTGKSYHDFRPGMATDDIWTVFVAPMPVEADGTTRFASHVEQMQSSACFRGSEGRMSCTTCHDPHSSPPASERVAFYQARCNSCHADRGCSLPIKEREAPPALDSCIHCHMPSSGSSDIPHTSSSDHRVLRNPRDESDAVDDSRPHAVWEIFGKSDERMPELEAKRARALALGEQAMEDSNPQLMRQAILALEGVRDRGAKDVEVLSNLGFFYCTTRNDTKAMETLAAALRADPDHELSLKNLGMMALQTGSLDTGRRSFERYFEVNKWDGAMYGPYAAIVAQSGDLRGAVDAVERGLRLDPTHLKLREFAVQLYARLGDGKKSEQHQEILREISKRLAPRDQKRGDRSGPETSAERSREP